MVRHWMHRHVGHLLRRTTVVLLRLVLPCRFVVIGCHCCRCDIVIVVVVVAVGGILAVVAAVGGW